MPNARKGIMHRIKWRESLRVCNIAAVNLLIQRDMFDYVLLNVDGSTEKGRIILFAAASWYEHFIAVAIRRQTDNRADSHSMLRVIRDMLDPALATYALTYKGDQFPSAKLNADLQKLESVSQKAKHFANKEVAHRAKFEVPLSDRPDFAEMHECALEFHEVVYFYTSMFCGAALLKAEPGMNVIPFYMEGKRFEQMEPTRETVGAYFDVPEFDDPQPAGTTTSTTTGTTT